jgi:hypothetical protein
MSRCQAGAATLACSQLATNMVTRCTPDASGTAWGAEVVPGAQPILLPQHTVHPYPLLPSKVQQAPDRGACCSLVRLVLFRQPRRHRAGATLYSSGHLVLLGLTDSTWSRVLLPASRRRTPQPCSAATWMFSRAVGGHHRPSHCSRLAASRLHFLAPPPSGRRASMDAGAAFKGGRAPIGGVAHVLGPRLALTP